MFSKTLSDDDPISNQISMHASQQTLSLLMGRIENNIRWDKLCPITALHWAYSSPARPRRDASLKVHPMGFCLGNMPISSSVQ